MSVASYQQTLGNIPEERRPQPHRGRILKSAKSCPFEYWGEMDREVFLTVFQIQAQSVNPLLSLVSFCKEWNSITGMLTQRLSVRRHM